MKIRTEELHYNLRWTGWCLKHRLIIKILQVIESDMVKNLEKKVIELNVCKHLI